MKNLSTKTVLASVFAMGLLGSNAAYAVDLGVDVLGVGVGAHVNKHGVGAGAHVGSLAAGGAGVGKHGVKAGANVGPVGAGAGVGRDTGVGAHVGPADAEAGAMTSAARKAGSASHGG